MSSTIALDTNAPESATVTSPATTAPALSGPVAVAPRRNSGIRLPVSDYCFKLLDRLAINPSNTAASTHTLGLTSCLTGEGVTTIASQIAVGAATYLRLQVVLVDCHFSRPGVHRIFGVELGHGLQDALEDPSRLRALLRPCGVENLTLLTAGTAKEEIGSTCRWPGPSRLLAELQEEFDLVVVDLPPVAEGQAVSIGTLLDGVLLVIESERVRWEVAQSATTTLESAGVPLIGAVMNKQRQHIPRWLYRAL